MNKPITLLVTIALSSAATSTALAQDTLFFHSGRIVAGTVDEIGLDAITYHEASGTVRLVVEKNEVARIKLHDGRVLAYRAESLGVEYSQDVLSKKHVVKMELLSLACDHLTLGYEQVLKPWMNLEARASYIGVGNGAMEPQATGLMVAAGMKFISRPDHVVRGMKLGHPLHGRYVKPEILFNTYTITSEHVDYYNFSAGGRYSYEKPVHVTYSNVVVNVVFGKQRFLGDGLTLDTWVGIGYGAQAVNGNNAYEEETRSYNYSHVLLGKELPIALSCGMSLGLAF
ncbi:MAG: hypothetical protein JNL43_11940 [Flavobacteriales bacterium]|nr:hypothetical protein [Flavobacteriales bacterium]